jgi:hypothetical protein
MWYFHAAAQHGLAVLCLATCVYLYTQILVMQDDIRSLIVCYRDLFVHIRSSNEKGIDKNKRRDGTVVGGNKGNADDVGLDYKHASVDASSSSRLSQQKTTTSSNVNTVMQQMFDLPGCGADMQQIKKRGGRTRT